MERAGTRSRRPAGSGPLQPAARRSPSSGDRDRPHVAGTSFEPRRPAGSASCGPRAEDGFLRSAPHIFSSPLIKSVVVSHPPTAGPGASEAPAGVRRLWSPSRPAVCGRHSRRRTPRTGQTLEHATVQTPAGWGTAPLVGLCAHEQHKLGSPAGFPGRQSPSRPTRSRPQHQPRPLGRLVQGPGRLPSRGHQPLLPGTSFCSARPSSRFLTTGAPARVTPPAFGGRHRGRPRT